jgi:hypothetical protein
VHLASKDDELMPECSILGFEPTLRLEGRSQLLHSQEDQRNHSRQRDAILSPVQYGWGFRYTQGRQQAGVIKKLPQELPSACAWIEVNMILVLRKVSRCVPWHWKTATTSQGS